MKSTVHACICLGTQWLYNNVHVRNMCVLKMVVCGLWSVLLLSGNFPHDTGSTSAC